MPEMITSPGEQPSPKHIATVSALARSVVAGVAATGHPHAVLLDGLISAYATLLVQHPCCWVPAAAGIRQLADQVMQMHAVKVASEQAAEKAAADLIAGAMRPAA